MKYAELTKADVNFLRICAALEQTFPDAPKTASRVLEGYRQWRLKQWREAPVQNGSGHSPGMTK